MDRQENYKKAKVGGTETWQIYGEIEIEQSENVLL